MQKIKDFIRNNLGVVVISVSFICLFIGGCLLRSAGERGRNDTSATRAMAGVEDGINRAERGVRTAQREIANAESQLNGARKTTARNGQHGAYAHRRRQIRQGCRGFHGLYCKGKAPSR